MTETPEQPAAATPPAQWAHVEIFGQRRHFGRISEVIIAGIAMLRIEVPTEAADVFQAHHYVPRAIFSISPCTEQAAREWAATRRAKAAARAAEVAGNGGPVEQV